MEAKASKHASKCEHACARARAQSLMATLPGGGPAEDGSELRSHACGAQGAKHTDGALANAKQGAYMEQKERSLWPIVYRSGTMLYRSTREGSCRRCATQMAAAVAATSPANPTSSAHRCPLFDFQRPRPKCDKCLCGGQVGGRGASIQTGRPTRTSVRVRTWCLLCRSACLPRLSARLIIC